MAGEGEGELVGYLEVRIKGNESNGKCIYQFRHRMVLTQVETPDLIEIYGHNQFYLGRNASLW
jgi:hypothetical protein